MKERKCNYIVTVRRDPELVKRSGLAPVSEYCFDYLQFAEQTFVRLRDNSVHGSYALVSLDFKGEGPITGTGEVRR